MIWFNRCDSRLTMCTSFLSSSSSGARRASSFSAPVIAVSGWRISCAIAAESRPKAAMRSFVDYFPFETLQFGQVLEVVNEAGVLVLRRAQRRNRKAEEADRTVGVLNSISFRVASGLPCSSISTGQKPGSRSCTLSPRISPKPGTGDFGAGAIHAAESFLPDPR